MTERIAKALNLLGADRDLLGVDSYELLELIDDYCADDSEAHGEYIATPPFN